MRTHAVQFRAHAAAPVAGLAMLAAALIVEPASAQVVLTFAAALCVVRIGRRGDLAMPSVATVRAQELALERRRIRRSAFHTSLVAFALATGAVVMLLVGRMEGMWSVAFWFGAIAGTLTVGNGIALIWRLRGHEPSWLDHEA